MRYDFMMKPILIGTMLAASLAGPAYAQTSEDNGDIARDPITGEIPIKGLQRLRGSALTRAFFGRTMVGTYKGVNERSGTSRFTESFLPTMTTIYQEGKVKDKGRWGVQNDQVCFRYSGALAGGLSCFAVFKKGTCYYSYDPDYVIGDRPIDTNFWGAKTRYEGERGDCDDLIG